MTNISAKVRNTIIIAVLILLAIIFPLTPMANNFFLQIGILISVHIIFGLSWNLLGGYTGQISFGHAMFYGIGAYTSMILMNDGVNPITSVLTGAVFAVILAVPVGMILFKLRGPFFALGTLATAEIIRLIATNWTSLTGGGAGLLLMGNTSIPLGFTTLELTSRSALYYVALVFALLTILAMYLLINSRAGYYFISIRENEDASLALGINTKIYKVYALACSAFFTGIAGGIMTIAVGIIEPHPIFNVHLSAEMIFTAIIGGIGTIIGPIVGAFTLVILTELLREWIGTAYLMIYGLLLMLVILYMPEGIYGWLKKRFSKESR